MIPNQSTYERRVEQIPYIPTEEEADLLRRAQQQDATAFTQLCRKHLSATYATCLRMLGNEGEAKELTQETIVTAWEKLHGFRGECPFSAWLHRIAVNAVLDYLKVHRRLTNKIEFTDEVESYETVHHTIGIEATIDLEKAITMLPAQARTVLVLHDIEGYQHNEIAVMLGIAVGTSKAHLHNARMLLKEMLQQ